jgi:transposase
MWKPEHRLAADRRGLRYPSDLSDSEWALIEPAIPPAKRGGRRREVNVREVLNAICYVLSTGCQWQALPKDLPPKSTAHSYFMLWEWDGTLERIHHALYVETREREGREASPTVAIIDSQSAKAAQKGARHSTRRALMRVRRSRAARGTSAPISITSRFSPNAGSWSARSRGSAETAAWRATSSATPAPSQPSYASP